MARIVGIDLGTTNSLVAVMRDGRPEILPDPHTGSPLLPSAASLLPDGTFLVGESARRRAALHPHASILSVKRFMGVGLEHVDDQDRREHAFDHGTGALQVVLEDGAGGTRKASPPEVSALILRELKRRAENALGEEVTRAVITVPAYFNDSQRQATRDAGRLAGLDVLRLVNEPTAAALAYGLDKQEEALVAVFDLGGGTFDVSILQLREGLSEVLATGGDTRLGGDDFDRRVIALLQTELGGDAWSAEDLAILRDAAERAKRELSAAHVATVEVPLGSGTRVVRLTREAFEAASTDLVERTLSRCRQALKDAGKQARDVDHVILVGGATRVPAVRRAVEGLFGKAPHADIDPDAVVALGAAVQAGILSGGSSDMLLLDVVPLSLGIETMGGVFTRLIDRNTTIPAAAREQFTTAVDDQTHVEVHVLQGERELAKDCRSLALFRIPIEPATAGLPRVEVTFLIDANGILSVSARDVRTNREHSIEVKPSYGLTEEQMENMLEEAFDLAEEDFAQRQLLEARVEAESILHATQKAERLHEQLLDVAERATIERAASALREACTGTDHNRIRDLIEALNEAGRPFAQRIMDASIKVALESKSAYELAG
ncbi:MAG: molecular chaperone DnaK [Deltaproteobacteria bacterium]|nr:molecular chaperone DnaK [Deltaproteobacteria bacterium]